ncbi:GTPase ObgE [Brucepastera parasyntrophica]|uniref:Obg family GTPase CgtA n=1 Tax=Brucepastera parasyntrophica TaxID=2880008 RepID=UPI00210A0527|nr:Obg family GTPase CgtA [Brucepastera parasyntrophica]ULQ60490.1 GTPase ObgE [Brucepastera parasyntrophica]
MIKFADEALITVSSGKGGNGCIAFRREKYIPNGGPSGGDGGRGGDVIFEIRPNLRTLAHLRYKQTFKAKNGGDGEGNQRFGKDGEDCTVLLPPGCLLRDADTGELVHDFGMDYEGSLVFLRGGNGGWGNVHFKSSVNQAPRTALPGQDGETRKLRVELNIIADIGFVGFPNAGKSSLLEFFTNARPKIAPYPFTTKIPHLGVLRIDETRDIILADIPGIIEGASEGRGMGIRFLKHISRSAGLAYIIDLSEEDFLGAFDKLKSELEEFSPELAQKQSIVIATKLDLPETREHLAELHSFLAKKYPGLPVLGVSVQNRWGLEDAKKAFMELVQANETAAAPEDDGFSGTAANSALDFMLAEPADPEYGENDGGFGATVSLSRKRRGRKK